MHEGQQLAVALEGVDGTPLGVGEHVGVQEEVGTMLGDVYAAQIGEQI